MASNALLTLYSFRRCPYAMRARLALLSSRVRCEMREIVLRAKPDAMLAVSPKGTVPVLITPDGGVLEQSLDIMLWALQQNDPEAWLTPDQGSLREMLALIATCDGEFKFSLDRYKYPERYIGVDALVHRETASQFVQALEMRLSTLPYLFGQHCSLADMAIAPFVRQFAHTDKAWFANQAWPNLHRWLDRLLSGQHFDIAMTRYAPWSEGQAVMYFPLAATTAQL